MMVINNLGDIELNLKNYVENPVPESLLSNQVSRNEEFYKNDSFEEINNLISGVVLGEHIIRSKNEKLKVFSSNRRFFIGNSDVKIPCGKPIKTINGDIVLPVYFLPNDEIHSVSFLNQTNHPVKLDEGNLLLMTGNFLSHVSSVLPENYVLELFSSIKNYLDEDEIRNRKVHVLSSLLSNGIKGVNRRIELFYEKNFLGFFSILHLLSIDFIDFEPKKLLDRFVFDMNSYGVFSDTTYQIFDREELVDELFQIINTEKVLLDIFEFDLLFGSEKNKIPYQFRYTLEPIKRFELDSYFQELNDNHEYQRKDRFLFYKHNLPQNNLNVIPHHGKTVKKNLRKIENEIRLSKGYEIVGSLVNESLLFEKIKNHFKGYEVVSQGSPDWLGRQRLDIYFTDLNIGIEYQGRQHFEPISFFGGKKGLEETRKRDRKKKRLCKQHNCDLIEVLPDYDFEVISKKINQIIQNKTIENL